MPNIGVIDDRPDVRSTLVQNIELELETEDKWDVEEASPLPSVEAYPSWIYEHDIATLVVDERLGEQGHGGRAPVKYAGHDLVEYLRKALPTLPIFVVTSHGEDEVLQETRSEVEDIVPRDKFYEDPTTFVARMVRAGRKYAEEYEQELAQLTEISQRIVAGQATTEDIKRAEAIREYLARSPRETETATRAEWLKKVEQQLGDLKELKAEIEQRIRSKTKKAGQKNDWPAEPSPLHDVCAYPSPAQCNYGDFIQLDANTGVIDGVNTAVRYVIERLYLNRPQLLLDRRVRIAFAAINDYRAYLRRLMRSVEDVALLRRICRKLDDLIQLHQELMTALPYATADVTR